MSNQIGSFGLIHVEDWEPLIGETHGKHSRTDEFMTVSVSRREMIGSNYASLLQFEAIFGIEILSIHLLASTIVCRVMASKIEVYGHVPIISTITNRLINSNGRPTARDSSFIHISVKPFQVCRLFEGRCKPNYTYRSQASGR